LQFCSDVTYSANVQVICAFNLSLLYEENQIRKRRTVAYGLMYFAKHWRRFIQLSLYKDYDCWRVVIQFDRILPFEG